jgi:hypothetical protein
VGKEGGYFSMRHQQITFCKRVYGVKCMVRIDSLNILKVSFRLEMESTNLGNLVCSAGNLEANYLTT